jgi:uncharacterized protein YbbC (DUF1343 family)
MLKDVTLLVFDVQDVGVRYYTYLTTLVYVMEEAARQSIPLVVLDRPNPITGRIVEGPVMDPDLGSFTAPHTIPVRTGMTMGEFARMVAAERRIPVALTVIPMEGWERSIWYDDTGLPWVNPSPNLRNLTEATLYPGVALIEGTNVSVGRGTDTPFEVVGAPFIDPHVLAGELAALKLPGLAIRPIRFVPTFDKWSSQRCGGLALHALDTRAIRSVTITLQILATVRRLYPKEFAWLPPPYEYEHDKMPIDILFGSSRLREALLSESPLSEATMSDATINDLARLDEAAWWRRVQPYLLYA